VRRMRVVTWVTFMGASFDEVTTLGAS